jgi:hypothetical protein
MKKALLACILLIMLISISNLFAAGLSGEIEEFSLSDLPDDDGSGVILRWKPLSKDHRIIQYNIYRGVSPDSLFLLTYLEVDPRMGVLAPYLYYYDTGDQPLFEFETSPMSLKKEKDQAEDSPLYGKFPLDEELLGTIVGRYFTAALTKASNLHKHSRQIEKEDKLYSGLKLTQMEGVYAIPQAGTTYYYSVAAMNERGKVYPGAEVQGIVPIDDAPDATAIMHSTYVAEEGLMKFEWLPPNTASDIAVWEAWLLPRNLVTEDKVLPDNWQNAAIPVFEYPKMVQYSSVYYHEVQFDASSYPPEQYIPVLSYRDYLDQQSAVLANSYRHISADDLPNLPDFKVMDKANDKGDNMLISFGKPLAYITLAEFTAKNHKKLKLNYEISDNENYTVDKVKFVFSTKDGVSIGSVTENYIDKVFSFDVPAEYRDIKHFHADISVMLLTAGDYEAEVVSQDVVYNEYFKRFQPQSTFVNSVDIGKLYFDVLSRAKLDWDFSNGSRANALTRTFDHTIPFEDVVFKPIFSYDAETSRFLIDERLSLAIDEENGYSFSVPLSREFFLKEMQQKRSKIEELEAKLAETQDTAETSAELNYLKGEYEFISSHPLYKEAEQFTEEKAWLKFVLSAREQAMRSYSYKLVASDTHGAFRVSPLYQSEAGEEWFYPISQWFDTSKTLTLIATILLLILVLYAIIITKHREVYIRPIAGLQELDNAIGRATEMGRPVMFVPGWGTLGDVCTIASLMILAQVAKKTAEYDIRLINPHCDYMVLPLAQEIVSTSYSEMGRPDSFNQNDIFFVSYDQFPFCAGVNGITVRERVATIFYMGFFNAEALLLTETGNQTGAIQIAATDAVTQIPFFITTCDYTLIGEEFYAASAYLSHNHDMVSMLKAQDYFKLFIILGIVLGTVLSTLNISGFIHMFPLE